MKKYFLLFTPLMFFSCEGNTNREYNVANNSQDSITVFVDNNFYNQIDTYYLAPQGNIEILEHDQRGGTDNAENIGNVFTELLILNSTGDTCTKSHTIDYNWNTAVKQVKKVPSQWEHDYTFVVEDGDF